MFLTIHFHHLNAHITYYLLVITFVLMGIFFSLPVKNEQTNKYVR